MLANSVPSVNTMIKIAEARAKTVEMDGTLIKQAKPNVNIALLVFIVKVMARIQLANNVALASILIKTFKAYV